MTQIKTFKLTVEERFDKSRLDRFLAEQLPDNSRSFFQKLIKDGAVKIDGAVCTVPRQQLRTEQEVCAEIPEPQESAELIAENIDLPVLYEDSSIIVINKPPGLVVHPGAGNYSGTVVNALLGRDPEFGEELPMNEGRPGIVHRLDKDTSGCLVVAKTAQAMFKLSRSFAGREVKKTYAALVNGIPRVNSEKIVTLIGRHPVNRKKMAVVNRNGKEAVTLYEVLEAGRIDGAPASLLSVRIMTGRTHQIRVHLAFRGLPIIGDEVYGGTRKISAPRQMLHAWKLTIPHPETGEELSFEAPLPEDFCELWSEAELEH